MKKPATPAKTKPSVVKSAVKSVKKLPIKAKPTPPKAPPLVATAPLVRKKVPSSAAKTKTAVIPKTTTATPARTHKIKPALVKKPLPAPKEKIKKPKLIRDSFTMPEAEYQVLDRVKKECLKAGIDIKKSQLLRIGVALISKMELASLKNVLTALPPLKTGRPKKN